EHMLNCIECADEFYAFTANELPKAENVKVIDLGCGTGLELNYYFNVNPNAMVTGIDLSEKMLSSLKSKFKDKDITLIQGSYFDVPFGEKIFDGAVSVESLHHFTLEEKIPLYKKIYDALRENSSFILTDYFSCSNEEENFHRNELMRLKQEQGISDSEFYHYDTPLTTEHETEALKAAGFTKVEIINSWGQTSTIKATK
ncbi:MAG: class I SAM-dependent methyltransferase, partial [Clostridia bacterium]|nr:class I SAM-dependent methyltransferase [Clostridia bacterium]